MPAVTILYAGFLGLFSIALSEGRGSCAAEEASTRAMAADADLLRAMRRHANFIEYVPLALVLIALIETERRTLSCHPRPRHDTDRRSPASCRLLQ